MSEKSLLATLVEAPTPPGGTAATPPSPPARKPLHEGDDSFVDIIPYHADDDPNANYFLPWMWKQLYDDGLISLYFPAAPEKSFATFAKMFSASATRVVLVVIKDAAGEVTNVVGFSTWEPTSLGPATVGLAGFIFLREYWDRKTSLAAGMRILRFWFDEMSEKLDIAIGLIADTNRPANLFVQRLGWTKSGFLPGCHQYDGKQANAVLWTITREQFDATEAAAAEKAGS